MKATTPGVIIALSVFLIGGTGAILLRHRSYAVELRPPHALPSEDRFSSFQIPSPAEGEALLSWLGGKRAIERVLVARPPGDQAAGFTKGSVRKRLEEAFCRNRDRDSWHYAPLTRGVIYLRDGRAVDFEMYLSGISAGGEFFAGE